MEVRAEAVGGDEAGKRGKRVIATQATHTGVRVESA